MTLRFIRQVALGAMLILTLQLSSASAHRVSRFQEGASKARPAVSRETYDQVLDIVFPRTTSDPSQTVFAFVLRFRPSFKPESQIVIRRGVEKIEVFEYTPTNGHIYAKLNEILTRTGKEDAVEMAKSIRVRRREMSSSSAHIQRWYAALFDSLAETTKLLKERGEEFDKTKGSETVMLDGTLYELWYENRINQMSFALQDVEIDAPGSDGEFKLVRWMNTIRREVAKMK